MIAPIWRGAIRNRHSDSYVEYMQRTGVAEYAATEGNLGVWMLRRNLGELTEIVMLTLWESLDAIRRFAGEGDRILVERDLVANHYTVAASRTL